MTTSHDSDAGIRRPATEIDLGARLDALDASQRELDRSWHRTRWLALTGVAILPAWLIWGLPGVMISTLVVVVLVGATYYVIWNHKQEYRAESEMIHTRITHGERMRPAPPPPPRWNASRRRRAGWL